MNEGRLKFFKLVKEMRAEQKRYFASRSHDALVNARMLEQRVDEEISRGDRSRITGRPVQFARYELCKDEAVKEATL